MFLLKICRETSESRKLQIQRRVLDHIFQSVFCVFLLLGKREIKIPGHGNRDLHFGKALLAQFALDDFAIALGNRGRRAASHTDANARGSGYPADVRRLAGYGVSVCPGLITDPYSAGGW